MDQALPSYVNRDSRLRRHHHRGAATTSEGRRQHVTMIAARSCLRAAGGRATGRAAAPLAALDRAHASPLLAPKRENSVLIVGGLAVAAGAMGAKHVMQFLEARKAAAAAEPSGDGTEAKKAAGASGSSWFDSWGRKYYEGPFEDEMTRREAALVLGVRESATAQRIKDAHRKILRLNHPDMGGSAFLSAKVNEAKELLIKGKEQTRAPRG